MTHSRVHSLLGRWHQWRRAYSHERGFVRAQFAFAGDDEDELEALTMRLIEDEIAALPRDEQLALQHVARAECMGVEVIFNPRLGSHAQREAVIERALSGIARRLLRLGIL
jgi:hypothetical protein